METPILRAYARYQCANVVWLDLAEEDQLFSTGANGKRVWVIEDAHGYTIMYPEDY